VVQYALPTGSKRMPFVVPPEFLRNAPDVIAMGPPADVALSLLDYMCRRLGLSSLEGKDVLDFGCGTRFADAIMNRDVPLRSYVGIDVNASMVDFLAGNADDPRLEFHLLHARNPLYNPGGVPMTVDWALPVGGRTFDVICMFSVITHQLPEDARTIFSVLRRYIRDDGRLFFSVCLEDTSGLDYCEGDAARPTLYSGYSSAFLGRLLAETGWRVESCVGPDPEGLPILDSLVCAPA
jgi:SAM-dependent methyltransferase